MAAPGSPRAVRAVAIVEGRWHLSKVAGTRTLTGNLRNRSFVYLA